MENLSLEGISSSIIDFFEKFGISSDNLIILAVIFLLILENNTDTILIMVLVLLLSA